MRIRFYTNTCMCLLGFTWSFRDPGYRYAVFYLGCFSVEVIL